MKFKPLSKKLEYCIKISKSARNKELCKKIEKNPKFFFSYAKKKSETASSFRPIHRKKESHVDESKAIVSEPRNVFIIHDPTEFIINNCWKNTSETTFALPLRKPLITYLSILLQSQTPGDVSI